MPGTYEDVVNSLSSAAVTTSLTIAYSALGKQLFKVSEPKVGMDAMDGIKLGAYVAAAEYTKRMLVMYGVLSPILPPPTKI